jgi:hypothetical protein
MRPVTKGVQRREHPLDVEEVEKSIYNLISFSRHTRFGNAVAQ